MPRILAYHFLSGILNCCKEISQWISSHFYSRKGLTRLLRLMYFLIIQRLSTVISLLCSFFILSGLKVLHPLLPYYCHHWGLKWHPMHYPRYLVQQSHFNFITIIWHYEGSNRTFSWCRKITILFSIIHLKLWKYSFIVWNWLFWSTS